MDRRQHGYSTVRTNHDIRRAAKVRIGNFFDEARERLPVPVWEEEANILLEPYKMDPAIHPFFYEHIWEEVTVYIKDVGNFRMKAKIGMLEDNDGEFSDYWMRIHVPNDGCPQKILDYFNRIDEMNKAEEALKKAAHIALQETTVEKALIRMPELKRFIS